MLNLNKLRHVLAILLGLAALVGLAWKAGIYIPVVSHIVIAIVQAISLLLSVWIDSPTVFLAYVKSFQEHVVWCVSATWLGISAWLWSTRTETSEGFWKIVSYYYLFMAVVISSTVFALGYHFDPAFKIKFYSSTFSLGLFFGFSVGKFWHWVEGRTVSSYGSTP